MLKESYTGASGAAHESPLAPWACTSLAILAGSVGLASAVITTRFFVLGLERLEPDAPARDALIAAGVLMIIVELLAFCLAALLPRAVLRAARYKLLALGFALLAFEGGTLYITQAALVEASQAASRGQTTRVAALRASIETQRAALATIQSAADRQSQSQHAWIRNAGLDAAKKVLQLNATIAAEANELAQLEAVVVPTTTDILGEQGMVAYAVARSLLLVLMGVVLFSVAGALMRAGRSVDPRQRAATLPSAPLAFELAPTTRKARGRYAAVPFAALAAGPAAFAHPTVTVQAWAPAHPTSDETAQMDAVPHEERRVAASNTRPQRSETWIPTSVRDSGTGEEDGGRFQRVRAEILTGGLKPSLRAIYAAHGATQAVASRYLAAMLAAGELKRVGQGYAVA